VLFRRSVRLLGRHQVGRQVHQLGRDGGTDFSAHGRQGRRLLGSLVGTHQAQHVERRGNLLGLDVGAGSSSSAGRSSSSSTAAVGQENCRYNLLFGPLLEQRLERNLVGGHG